MVIERHTGLAAVLDVVRRQDGITQALVTQQVGLGRSVVAERVAELEGRGLLRITGLAPSTGGRAPRRLSLNSQAGIVVGVDIATEDLVVGAADLGGMVLASVEAQIDITDGPEVILELADELVREVLLTVSPDLPLLGIGAGLPGPIDVATGSPTDTPVLTGWGGFPVEKSFAQRWGVPARIDNRVNLLALAELAVNPAATDRRQVLYVGLTDDVATALVVDGEIYRGHHGLAGSIGHVAVPDARHIQCQCGSWGCLEALIGGWALVRDATTLAQSGTSPALSKRLQQGLPIRALEVTDAALSGDAPAMDLLNTVLTRLGQALSPLIALIAPELVIVGGGITHAGAWVLDPIAAGVDANSSPGRTPRATLELSVVNGQLGAMTGATRMALNHVLDAQNLAGLLERVAAPKTLAEQA